MRTVIIFLMVLLSSLLFSNQKPHPRVYTLAYEKQTLAELKKTGMSPLSYSKIQSLSVLEKSLLSSESRYVRKAAAKSLQYREAARSTEVLIEAAQYDRDRKVKLSAAIALAFLGEKSVSLKILMSLCSSGSQAEKIKCNRAFREINNRKAIEQLLVGLEDNDAFVSVSSAVYLAQLHHNEKSFSVLSKHTSYDDVYVRLSALRGLAYIGDERSLDLVAMLAGDRSKLVRDRVVMILKNYGVALVLKSAFQVEANPVMAGGSYDPGAAAVYAERWWNSINPAYNYYDGLDCANFASQCLMAGGLDLSAGTNGAGAGVDSKGAIPNCNNQHTHLRNHHNVVYERRSSGTPSWFVPGDIAILGNSADRWKHSIFAVTGSGGSSTLVNAHNSNKQHKKVSDYQGGLFSSTDFYHISTAPQLVPSVVTTGSSRTTDTSTQLNATITPAAVSPTDERRFEWGLRGTWTDYTSDVQVSSANFSFVLAGLAADQEYNYRAWAHNSAGWSMGNTVYFATRESGDSDEAGCVYDPDRKSVDAMFLIMALLSLSYLLRKRA